MELVKYRDQGMATYTWFWIDQNQQIASPFFDSQEQALDWLKQQTQK